MKINKQKLFQAIKNGETKDFSFTYSNPNEFNFSYKDIRFYFDGIEFRSFEEHEEFELVTFITHDELEKVKTGFEMLKEKLEKLGAIMEDKK